MEYHKNPNLDPYEMVFTHCFDLERLRLVKDNGDETAQFIKAGELGTLFRTSSKYFNRIKTYSWREIIAPRGVLMK